jgi:hypothetical protein
LALRSFTPTSANWPRCRERTHSHKRAPIAQSATGMGPRVCGWMDIAIDVATYACAARRWRTSPWQRRRTLQSAERRAAIRRSVAIDWHHKTPMPCEAGLASRAGYLELGCVVCAAIPRGRRCSPQVGVRRSGGDEARSVCRWPPWPPLLLCGGLQMGMRDPGRTWPSSAGGSPSGVPLSCTPIWYVASPSPS